MENQTIYLKLERDVAVRKNEILLKDLGAVYCKDKGLQEKAEHLRLDTFENKETKRLFVDVMKVVPRLEQLGKNVTIENLGECDVAIERVADKEPSKLWQGIKTAFVVLISFFGTAFTIMAFHNDIAIKSLFDEVYYLIMGEQNPGFTYLELSYSIGLAVGIIVFFNHFGKKRKGLEPTPIEVEMKLYESDIVTTLIETEKRKK